MAESKIPVDLILSKLAGDAEKAPERIQKAKDVLLSELDTAIAATPYEVVYQEDRVKLKHYYPVLPKNKLMKTPLLVVYALINRETMLDLQPGRSIGADLPGPRDRGLHDRLGIPDPKGPLHHHRRPRERLHGQRRRFHPPKRTICPKSTSWASAWAARFP